MRDRIRILFVVDQIYSSSAGTEQNISFLLHHLPKHRFEIHIAVLRDTGFCDPKFFTVEPVLVPFGSFSSFIQLKSAISHLSQIIRERRIDVVHTFFPDSELLSILATRMGMRCALIATRRNMGFRHTSLSLWRTRFTNQFITHFLANSKKVKEFIGKLEWIPQNKINVIYNPLQKDRIEEGLRKSFLKGCLGINNGEKIIGIVANLTPVKDYSTFLRAAAIINKKNPETKFVIVGDSDQEEKKKFDFLISNLGLEAKVIYVGKHENPIPLIKLFDVGVICSKSEGLSNSLIEYGALCVPTVATNVGGNPEVVIDGVTGFLIPPSSPELLAKHILKLLENEDLRRAFGENAKKLVYERFDQDLIISKYEKYYQKIINITK